KHSSAPGIERPQRRRPGIDANWRRAAPLFRAPEQNVPGTETAPLRLHFSVEFICIGKVLELPTGWRRATPDLAATIAARRSHMPLTLGEHEYVVPVATDKVIADGAVAFDGDRIVFVGKRADFDARRFPPAKVVDARGKAVLPGLVNTHCHLVGAYMK